MRPKERALYIVEKLVQAGHTAYFAGGYVRDSLLGIPSTEIDIATSATPVDIQSLFPKTVAVGAAFGVIVVVYEEGSFEVATFRHDQLYVDGRHPKGVDFSTPEEDAKRRDFTINGMFLDPIKDQILDFVGGQEDLDKQIIRAIGDPQKRFEEDRLRMLRAVRFSHRLNFPIEKKTQEAIKTYADTLLPSVSIERIWQELTKMAAHGNFPKALEMMDSLGLLRVIFPELEEFSPQDLEGLTSSKLPVVAFLLFLFPSFTLEALLELCREMKTSGEEIKLLEYLYHAKHASDPQSWANLYADPRFEIFLLTLSEKEKTRHIEEKQRLSFYVKRIEAKKPLITAKDLMREGISAGPKMGDLLKRAEQIAINELIEDPKLLMERLKQDSTWP